MTPVLVLQHSPLVHAQTVWKSVQQSTPGTQPAVQEQPCEPTPPHAPAHEPWMTQLGSKPLPCGVHSVLAGQVLTVVHGLALAESMLLLHTLADVPLQPGV